ncbi:MAG: hypothetical protein ABL997_12115, partial [Planctomycetota bacterium]
GTTTHVYVGCDDGTLLTIDANNPALPKLVDRQSELLEPQRLVAQGDHLYVADGSGGLVVFDLQKPDKPKLVGTMPSVQARSLTLAWPWLYLADGPGGLVVVDIADPALPRALSHIDCNGESTRPDDATDVAVLFQYSRTRALDPLGERLERTRARHLVALACGLDGVRLVDVTEPTNPQLLHGDAQARAFRSERGDVKGIAFNTQFDLGSEGGGIKSRERDYLFVHEEYGQDENRLTRIRAFDVSDPLRPVSAQGSGQLIARGGARLQVVRAYNAPFLQQFVLAVGSAGTATLVDASKMPTGLQPLAELTGASGVRDLVVEEFAFDRLQDERGRWEKDISHKDCRYLTRDEILKVLRAPVPVPREAEGRYGKIETPDKEERR